MTEQEIRAKLAEIIVKEFGPKAEPASDGDVLEGNLVHDSHDMIMLALAVEDAFMIPLSALDEQAVVTFGDAVQVIHAKVSG